VAGRTAGHSGARPGSQRWDTDLHLAFQILDVLDEIADRTHNLRYKIKILASRAVALDAVAQRAGARSAAGETRSANATAITVLKQAVDLAQPGGFIRVFVDLGDPCRRCCAGLSVKDTRGGDQSHPGGIPGG